MSNQNKEFKNAEQFELQISSKAIEQLVTNQIVQHEVKTIDTIELIKTLWKGKLLIISTTFLFALASIFYVLSLPNSYKSEVILAPATEDSGGIGALASKFGGLASLAGVNLEGGTIDNTLLAMEIMKSRRFLTQVINNYDLLVPLMASRGWDSVTGKLLIDPDIYSEKDKKWVRKVSPPFGKVPSNQEAYQKFKEIFTLNQDEDTTLIKVTIEHYSPVMAKTWVEILVKEINLNMKNRDLLEAGKSVKYLEEQIEETRLAEVKNVLYQIMEEQTKTIMFTQVKDEYAFKIIDPAVIPEIKAGPKRALIVIFITMLGAMLSCLIVLIRSLSSED